MPGSTDAAAARDVDVDDTIEMREQSITTASLTVWPACEVPPPRGVTGTPSARQSAMARSASAIVRGTTTPTGMIW